MKAKISHTSDCSNPKTYAWNEFGPGKCVRRADKPHEVLITCKFGLIRVFDEYGNICAGGLIQITDYCILGSTYKNLVLCVDSYGNPIKLTLEFN